MVQISQLAVALVIPFVALRPLSTADGLVSQRRVAPVLSAVPNEPESPPGPPYEEELGLGLVSGLSYEDLRASVLEIRAGLARAEQVPAWLEVKDAPAHCCPAFLDITPPSPSGPLSLGPARTVAGRRCRVPWCRGV